MASIVPRKRADGSVVYRAQVVIKKSGVIVARDAAQFDDMRTAERWGQMRERELRESPKIVRAGRARSAGPVRLADLAPEYLEVTTRVRTIGRTKRAGIEQLAGFPIAEKPIQQLTERDYIDHAIWRLGGGTQPQTVIQDYTWMRVLLRYAKATKGVRADMEAFEDALEYCRGERLIQKPRRRKRRPSNAELVKMGDFMRAAPVTRGPKAPPLYLILWLAIYSSRRQAEMFKMRLSDFDRGRMRWLIRDVKSSAGSAGNDKWMQVTPQMLKVVDVIIDEVKRAPGEDRLLPYNPKTVGTYFTRLFHMLEIEDFRYHDFRHEACSRLAEDGWTIPQIQQVSLHDSWGSLQIYVNLQPSSEPRVEFEWP